MKKKFALFFILSFFALTLAACGSKPNSNTTTSGAQGPAGSTTTAGVTGGVTDLSVLNGTWKMDTAVQVSGMSSTMTIQFQGGAGTLTTASNIAMAASLNCGGVYYVNTGGFYAQITNTGSGSTADSIQLPSGYVSVGSCYIQTPSSPGTISVSGNKLTLNFPTSALGASEFNGTYTKQ